MNVGEDTTRRNCDTAQQFVKFFVISYSELDVTWDNSSLLIVSCRISSKLKNFGCQIFHDGCHVNRRPCSNSVGISAFSKETMDTTHGKL